MLLEVKDLGISYGKRDPVVRHRGEAIFPKARLSWKARTLNSRPLKCTENFPAPMFP